MGRPQCEYFRGGREGRPASEPPKGPPGANREMLNATASFSFLSVVVSEKLLVHSGRAAGRGQYVPWSSEANSLLPPLCGHI